MNRSRSFFSVHGAMAHDTSSALSLFIKLHRFFVSPFELGCMSE
jgi:hypothetical protein